MRTFRKKQKIIKKIMQILIIFTALFLFVYIGVEPIIANHNTVALVLSYLTNGLVVACLIFLFLYYSKYGKSDKFLENIEYELSDIGYYYTARSEKSVNDYMRAVVDDLKLHGFSINQNEVINELEFDTICRKRGDLIYIHIAEQLDKNDIIAYLDSAMYDVTSVNVRRKANGVALFICDKADDAAVSISKMITPLGKKEQIKFANAIVELSTGRVYFLGNKVSRCQQLIANFVMNCELPIKEQFMGTQRLDFQDELEEHMKSFNIKDFNNGKFYAH